MMNTDRRIDNCRYGRNLMAGPPEAQAQPAPFNSYNSINRNARKLRALSIKNEYYLTSHYITSGACPDEVAMADGVAKAG
jgi:hypothetical protein